LNTKFKKNWKGNRKQSSNEIIQNKIYQMKLNTKFKQNWKQNLNQMKANLNEIIENIIHQVKLKTKLKQNWKKFKWNWTQNSNRIENKIEMKLTAGSTLAQLSLGFMPHHPLMSYCLWLHLALDIMKICMYFGPYDTFPSSDVPKMVNQQNSWNSLVIST
jgi:hypothetical protein